MPKFSLNKKKKFFIWIMVFNLSSCSEDLSVCECMEKGALIDKEISGCDYLSKLPIKELDDSVKNCVEKMIDDAIKNLNKENNTNK